MDRYLHELAMGMAGLAVIAGIGILYTRKWRRRREAPAWPRHRTS
jgi:hypothetical protein